MIKSDIFALYIRQIIEESNRRLYEYQLAQKLLADLESYQIRKDIQIEEAMIKLQLAYKLTA